jgi:phosphate acyltransferase
VTATVALDAMGGDRAPDEIVAGAAAVANEGIEVLLCGPAERLAAAVAPYGAAASHIEIVDAPDVIATGEDPTSAVRAKSDSSLVRACRLVREGRAQAAVSAGSTGAMLAASLLQLRRIPGVARPGIAVVLPARGGKPAVLIDAGANAEARADHLAQFAVMGAVFAEDVLGIERPAVGLLSIGSEPTKGDAVTLEAHRLISALDLNFTGNCEGYDALRGEIDVIVADGFTGNVLLKALEGAGRVLFQELREAAESDARSKLGGLLLRPALRRVRARMDSETYGGGYLLGLRGVSVIAHGNSSRRAIANALRLAAVGAEGGMVQRLEARLVRVPAGRGDTVSADTTTMAEDAT